MSVSTTIEATTSTFTNLGKLKIIDVTQVVSAQKKLNDLFLTFSFGIFKATLMTSLISELIKQLFLTEKNVTIQVGITNNETAQLIFRMELTSEIDESSLNGLNMAFDNVSSTTSENNNYLIDFGSNIINQDIHLNDEFIQQIVQKIEIKTQEELLKEVRESNESLNISLGKFEEVNQELDAFSYSVSHDLRAPLRHMVGFAELLKKHLDTDDEKTTRFLNNILESSKRMGQLIDDLLSFSRTGKAEIKLRTLDINEIVNSVKSELTTNIENKNIQWTIHSLPKTKGDRALIRLVFQNLISNAIKYSGKKEISIIEIGSLIEKEGENTYFVKDNGAGFNMKYENKLFGVFSRLHRIDEFEGTGIGLANVKRIIHRHKGRVWANGEEGKGATFYFTL